MDVFPTVQRQLSQSLGVAPCGRAPYEALVYSMTFTKQLAVQAGLLAEVSRPFLKLSSHPLSNIEGPQIFRPKLLDNQEFCMYTCFIETFQ